MGKIGHALKASFLYIKNKIPRKLVIGIGLVAISFLLYAVYPYSQSRPLTEVEQKHFLAEVNTLPPLIPLSLITEPDEGTEFLQEKITEASTSLDLVMYELQDQDIEQ